MGKDGEEKVSIKALLEQNAMIVCDTNIYMHIYEYAEGYCDYAIECLNKVRDYIIVPSIIDMEYQHNKYKGYKDMKNRMKTAEDAFAETIKKAKSAMLKSYTNLDKLGFPELDVLMEELDKKLDEQLKTVGDFFAKRSKTMQLLDDKWMKEDLVDKLFKKIKKDGHLLQEFSQEELFRLCEDCESRFSSKDENKKAPGSKDTKKKGIHKYKDFLWWEQVKQYAKRNHKNIILVTDDTKDDWFDKNADGTKTFRKALIEEFSKNGHDVYPYTAHEFYNAVAKDYGIEIPDIIDFALKLTDEDYCNRIESTVYEEIEDSIYYYAVDFVDESTSNLGDMGLDGLEILDHKFVRGKRKSRTDDEVKYQLEYNVRLSGNSYSYSGRDEDTKEVYTSPGSYHEFEGVLIVEVVRIANMCVDFENENNYDSAEIVHGDLKQTVFEPFTDDDFEDYDEDDESEKGYNVKIAVGDEVYTINSVKDAFSTCPHCGKLLSPINDRGGVCQDCYVKYECNID